MPYQDDGSYMDVRGNVSYPEQELLAGGGLAAAARGIPMALRYGRQIFGGLMNPQRNPLPRVPAGYRPPVTKTQRQHDYTKELIRRLQSPNSNMTKEQVLHALRATRPARNVPVETDGNYLLYQLIASKFGPQAGSAALMGFGDQMQGLTGSRQIPEWYSSRFAPEVSMQPSAYGDYEPGTTSAMGAEPSVYDQYIGRAAYPYGDY